MGKNVFENNWQHNLHNKTASDWNIYVCLYIYIIYNKYRKKQVSIKYAILSLSCADNLNPAYHYHNDEE